MAEIQIPLDVRRHFRSYTFLHSEHMAPTEDLRTVQTAVKILPIWGGQHSLDDDQAPLLINGEPPTLFKDIYQEIQVTKALQSLSTHTMHNYVQCYGFVSLCLLQNY